MFATFATFLLWSCCSCPQRGGALLRLLGFRFRLVSLFFLLFQIFAHVRVRRRRGNVPSLGFGTGSGRQSVLSLLFGQFLQPGIHLDSQLIVHFLQVVDVDGHGHAHGTLIFLAALYGGVDHVVIVRFVAGSIHHVAGSKYAFRTVRGGQVLVRGYHEDANSGIERRRHMVRARSVLLTASGRFLLCRDLVLHLFGDRLFHVRAQLGRA